MPFTDINKLFVKYSTSTHTKYIKTLYKDQPNNYQVQFTTSESPPPSSRHTCNHVRNPSGSRQPPCKAKKENRRRAPVLLKSQNDFCSMEIIYTITNILSTHFSTKICAPPGLLPHRFPYPSMLLPAAQTSRFQGFYTMWHAHIPVCCPQSASFAP